MNTANAIIWDDTVLPFQLDRSDIRGRVARLDGVLDQVLKQHAYPAPIEALVAEATLLTALIGQTIKLRWKLSLQIRGKGPARLIATDYYGPDRRRRTGPRSAPMPVSTKTGSTRLPRPSARSARAISP